MRNLNERTPRGWGGWSLQRMATTIPEGVTVDSLVIAGVITPHGSWNWLMVVEFDEQWFLITSQICFSFEVWVFWTCHFPQETSLTWQCYHPHQRNTGLVKTGANAGTNTGQAQCCPQSLSKIDLSRFCGEDFNLWVHWDCTAYHQTQLTYQVQPDPKKESKVTDGISSAGIAENYWPVVSTCKSCNWGVFSKNLYLGPFIFSSCAMLGDCTCITTFDHFPA